jgi:hypothetical protein
MCGSPKNALRILLHAVAKGPGRMEARLLALNIFARPGPYAWGESLPETGAPGSAAAHWANGGGAGAAGRIAGNGGCGAVFRHAS